MEVKMERKSLSLLKYKLEFFTVQKIIEDYRKSLNEKVPMSFNGDRR